MHTRMHAYFQPAIDHTVLRLSRTHNREYPCVFGTQQAYLKDCHANIRLDLERSRHAATQTSALIPSRYPHARLPLH